MKQRWAVLFLVLVALGATPVAAEQDLGVGHAGLGRARRAG